jgi:integrase
LIVSPFGDYSIPHYENSWIPYGTHDMKVILTLAPKTEQEELALDWVKLILHSGGSDPADFARLKGRHMNSDTVTMVRTKAQGRSGKAKKVMHLIGGLKKQFDLLKLKNVGKDDYVFPIFMPNLNVKQNRERLKSHMKRINYAMKRMLKDTGIEFTIKRLRPSSATIANNATKDLTFVQFLLGHSNLSTTDAYTRNTPSDLIKENQVIFEEALKNIALPEPEEEDSGQE